SASRTHEFPVSPYLKTAIGQRPRLSAPSYLTREIEASIGSCSKQTGGLRYSRPEACATFMYPMRHLASLVCIMLFGGFAFAAEKSADLKNLSLSGGIDQGKARLVIEGWLNGGAEQEKSAFAT